MAEPFIKSSFSAGEVSPQLYGRIDLDKWHAGCSVARNMFVNYKGGLSSRGGTAFVGISKQSLLNSGIPPRIIRFKFNLFQSYVLEFGELYMRVVANGGYVTETAIAITAISQAFPGQITATGNSYANGDWIFLANTGIPELDGETVIAQNVNGPNFTITDTFGDPIDTRSFPAYAGGGTAARIYTLTTPYHAVDLPYLKFTQSADVLSIAVVNQQTLVDYPMADLTRLAANNWTIATTSFAASIGPPTSPSATTSGGSGASTTYSYVVTAVDAETGEESIASAIASTSTAGDISLAFGTVTVTWTAPAAGTVQSYNIYKSAPSYTSTPVFPAGQLFGYAGTTQGATTWQDTNILADFTTTPPLNTNPFARGQIVGIGAIPATGTFTQATTSATINSATGSGGIIVPIVASSLVSVAIIQEAGQNYQPGDTVTFSDSGSGSEITVPLTVGPESGTYPGAVGYFQQRRIYGYTLNAPDTYNMSQPGAYTNMDTADPPIDSDAITGTPWAVQINGIQWMVPMPGGLLVCTGEDTWLLSGAGGAPAPVTPAQQFAQPQESRGFSPTVPPLRIGKDVLYVQALGTIVRDAQFNFYSNMYEGSDVTILSSHLFQQHQIIQWAWSQEPYKVVWAVRDDGKMLSFTYVPEQELRGWARHDTNGLTVSVATATEPPVDAIYWVVQRYIIGKAKAAYFIERMDNRLWGGNVEQVWAVDCGLALDQPTPNATLSASTASLLGGISGGNVILGGSNYTAPAGTIVDPTGKGSGAVVQFTLSGGAIASMTCSPEGQDYQPGSYVEITDATGTGAIVSLNFDNPVTFAASAPVFSSANVGSVIRMGGGVATISSVISPQSVNAQLSAPITSVVPDDPNNLPIAATSGNWTMTAPVSTISGLAFLEGMAVTGLADGSVIPSTVVANGSIALASPASQVTIGLPFIAQGQTLHADLPGQMIQGKSKKISAVTLRIANSRGVAIGIDQPIAATTANEAERPWGVSPYGALVEHNDRMFGDTGANAVNAGQAIPLFTGDIRIPVTTSDWNTPDGQRSPAMVAFQQSYPLPLDILAVIPEITVGDTNG